MPKSYQDYLWVSLQFLLFAFYLIPIDWQWPHQIDLPAWPAALAIIIGSLLVLVAFLQLKTNLTAWPSPKEKAQLVTVGVFAVVRHPIYSGLFLILMAYAFYLENSYRLAVALLLLVVFYFKTSYEEARLTEKFPAYRSYQKRTGRFFPKMKSFMPE
jgi:protein-S-isoprenylcysteine O-methyltransferase Ste14